MARKATRAAVTTLVKGVGVSERLDMTLPFARSQPEPR